MYMGEGRIEYIYVGRERGVEISRRGMKATYYLQPVMGRRLKAGGHYCYVVELSKSLAKLLASLFHPTFTTIGPAQIHPPPVSHLCLSHTYV